ncbi:hypothetical protein ACJQWK_08574 [Exserohilum turcicum]
MLVFSCAWIEGPWGYKEAPSAPPSRINMKFSTSTILASTVALAAAAFDDPVHPGDLFSLLSQRTGTFVQNGNVAVYKDGLGINNDQQIFCEKKPYPKYAAMSVNTSGGLFLYVDTNVVQAYVDRTPEGKGAIKWSTGVSPIDAKFERGPFEINANNTLQFVDGDKRYDFQACPITANDPNPSQVFTVWLGQYPNPTGDECIPFTARALKLDDPQKCIYNGLP